MNASSSIKKRFKKLPCTRCGSLENVTADHIIPKQFLKTLGILDDMRGNFQPLCYNCNHIKGDLLDPQNPHTVKLLDYYISRWKKLNLKQNKRRNYIFRNLTVTSLSPEITTLVSNKKYLESVYFKQKLGCGKLSSVL